MELVAFLEKLAKTSLFNIEIKKMIGKQPIHIQQFFLNNNTKKLANELNNGSYYAHEIGVVKK